MRYLAAVSEWNRKRREVNTAHVYAVPRKGTKEYDEVKAIAATPAYAEKKAAAIKALGAGAKAKAAKALEEEIEKRIQKRKAPVAPEVPAKPARRPRGTFESETCEVCGGKYTYANAATHRKSQKHKKALHKQVEERREAAAEREIAPPAVAPPAAPAAPATPVGIECPDCKKRFKNMRALTNHASRLGGHANAKKLTHPKPVVAAPSAADIYGDFTVPNDQRDTRQYSQDNRAELDLLMELSKRLASIRRNESENDDEL